MMNRHRCFVSLDLPNPIRQAALAVQKTLGQRHPELRLTAPDNLHLTLKFLGEISPTQRDEVIERLRTISFPPFWIELGGAGSFSARILWVSVRGADALQRQVDDALKAMFAPEHRFMGHVTIARTKRMPAEVKETLESVAVPQAKAQVVDFSLQESHLSPKGPRYEPLAYFALTV